jgi:hypothetical protein
MVLEDAETGRLMGSFAQDMANTVAIREQMDDFAIRSLNVHKQQLLKVISKMKSFQ